MALVRWGLVAAMAAVAFLSVVYSFGLVGSDHANAAETQYYCPMHPQVVQNQPGDCPICGMTLVARSGTGPKASQAAKPPASSKAKDPHAGHRHNPSDPYACPMHPLETGLDASARCPICNMFLEPRTPAKSAPATPAPPASASATTPSPSAAAPATSAPQGVPGLVPVELALDRVQLIGMKTAPVVTEALVSELRTVGYVAVDEARRARVHTRVSGWIERLHVPTTGVKVRRGQPLVSLFNLELLPAQQEFLTARGWSEQPGAASGLEQDARTRLELLGMSPGEIDAIAKSGKPSRTLSVTAPISGHVIAKTAVQGGFVQPGTELFEIADLSKLWVLAEIYEHEMRRVAVGQAARITPAGSVGAPLEGKVAFIYPVLDSSNRTMRARIELDNADMKLSPGMYTDVTIQVGKESGLLVPREAVVDTGDHRYVFVAKEGGRFEPRLVSLGARTDDKVQILSGLSEGEQVVTTANFLIDSESRLRAAIEGAPSP